MLEGQVAFTGMLASMKRAVAFALVKEKGGTPRTGVTKATNVLIVGELGWPLLPDGRFSNSLAKAKAYGIPIASERRFLTWTGQAAPEQQTRTYSKEQLAALSKLSGDLIDQFAMFGLIEPRGNLYGFRDMAATRQIASLLASGVRLSTITQSLADIRKWLPDAGLSNLRLYPEASDRLLVEHGKGRTDKKGQFVLPMEMAKPDADALFDEAQMAEEAGDWNAAEHLYGLVMTLDPRDAAAAFNLANVLRAKNKPIDAEAAYRIAVERDPQFAEAWFNLADLLDEQRRGPEAIRCLEQALKADPDYADAVFNLALLLQRLERPSDAAAQWKRYMEMDRTSPWAGRAKRALKLCEMHIFSAAI
ncbi:MAG: tetratricopeptide repeat protein [Rhodomicrobium sp.]